MLIARHEAAHAVMRKMCGLGPTSLLAGSEAGYCAGTGTYITSEAALLIVLAGPLADVGYVFEWGDWEKSHSVDLSLAKQMIEENVLLRMKFCQSATPLVPLSPSEALKMQLTRAGDMLLDHVELIEELAEMLVEHHGFLSAQEVGRCLAEVEERFNGQR